MIKVANLCVFTMKVVGREDKVNEFIEIMNSKYDYTSWKFSGHPRHFSRVFGSWIVESGESDDGDVYVVLNGMCFREYGYYADMLKKYGEDYKGTHLIEQSKELGLDIEFYSSDGVDYSEYYLIKRGVLVKDLSLDGGDEDELDLVRQLCEAGVYVDNWGDFNI